MITPREAEELNPNEKDAVTRLEKRIDETLRKEYVKGKSVLLDKLPERYYVRLHEEISRRYGVAGWDVKYHSDQREGEWLEFRVSRWYGGTDH